MSERCRLYLITPPAIALPAFAENLRRALDAGDVASLQLRLKNVSDDEIRQAADALRPIAQARAPPSSSMTGPTWPPWARWGA